LTPGAWLNMVISNIHFPARGSIPGKLPGANTMKIKLDDMELFVAIVDTCSISAAAEYLELPKSNASRQLKQLEEALGARLLNRTTRSLELTEAGKTFYEGCQQMLERMECLQNRVQGKRQGLTGRLTVFSPNDFVRLLLREHMAEFAKLYPELELEFLSGATKPHLLHDKIDVMIQVDNLEDSSYIARKITKVKSGFFASPDYLARKGEPRSPTALVSHDCVMELNQDRQVRSWLYGSHGEQKTADVKPRYRCDSAILVRTLVEQGLGVAQLPNFMCTSSVAAGTLVELFDQRFKTENDVHAIHSSRRYVPEKIKAFLAFMDNAIAKSL